VGIFSPLWDLLYYINHHIVALNGSKFFAGMIMILINIGGKFLPIQFSKSTEEYLKYTVSKQLLIFGMAWLGTRDIYAALAITAIFTILSDYLLNEDCPYCIIPPKYRVLHNLAAELNAAPGHIGEVELNNALAIVDRHKKEQQTLAQRSAFLQFNTGPYGLM
jgi:hypothetical protein